MSERKPMSQTTEDKTDIQKILSSRWYLLGQPWCHSSQAGTMILAGNPDPHLGPFVADTEMMQDEIEEGQPQAIARHIIDLHNNNQSQLSQLREEVERELKKIECDPKVNNAEMGEVRAYRKVLNIIDSRRHKEVRR